MSSLSGAIHNGFMFLLLRLPRSLAKRSRRQPPRVDPPARCTPEDKNEREEDRRARERFDSEGGNFPK
jgi:hypothetical protein